MERMPDHGTGENDVCESEKENVTGGKCGKQVSGGEEKKTNERKRVRARRQMKGSVYVQEDK